MWPTRTNVTRLTHLGLVMRWAGDCVSVTLHEEKSGLALARGACDIGDARDALIERLESLRHGSNLASDALAQLGSDLTQAVLPTSVQQALRRAVVNGSVSIRVTSDAKALDLPWEILMLDGCHAGLAPGFSIVRDAKSSMPYPVRKSKSLSVLVVCANPSLPTYPRLASAEAEVQSVLKGLNAPECQRWHVDILRYARLDDLRRWLAEHHCDVLHFIGHGNDAPSGGFLIFEGGTVERPSLAYAEDLYPLLKEAGVQLLVLSACSTGGCSSAIGHQLAEAGVPAVVAMQFPIGDQAAHSFSRGIYASLAEGASVEEAVRHGRSAIQGHGSAWAAPVLILGSELEVWPEEAEPQPEAHNLPLEDRPFIGRHQDREEVRCRLEQPDVRVVTITGMGGMGKTRLARQLAIDLLPMYPGGVWFVPCDTLSSRDELIAAIAAGLRAGIDQVSEEGIAELLDGAHTLLVLDCFEGLLEHRTVITKILGAASSAQVLVTSRRNLDLPQEHEHKLQPMTLPRRMERTADALELFVQSAVQAKSNFALTQKNRAIVKALVKTLEAIPLAIVLAAGRLRHMSLEELLERVKEGRRMVVVSRRSSPDRRHDNLVQVLKDSFALLSSEEREAIDGLSVFRGGFAVEDAERVLDIPDALEPISLLYDHSLLGSQTVEKRTRFHMLDTVRECIEFLEERSETPSLDPYRHRHARYYADLAVRLRASFDEGEWSKTSARLWLDVGNYRAAIAFAVRKGDGDLLRQLARSLVRVFFEVGVRADFDAIVPGAEAAAIAANDLPLLAELHGLQGERCRRENRTPEAIEHTRRRADICQELGDAEAEADSVLETADQAFLAGSMDTALEMLERFARIDVQRISAPVKASALVIEARMALAKGDIDASRRATQRADEMMRGVGVDRQALYVWMYLSNLYRTVGEIPQSESIARRLIRDGLTSLHYQAVGQGLLQLASTLEEAGDRKGAAEAIALTLQIPKSVSHYLREESLRRWQVLQDSLSATVLENVSLCVVGDWKVNAQRIGSA